MVCEAELVEVCDADRVDETVTVAEIEAVDVGVRDVLDDDVMLSVGVLDSVDDCDNDEDEVADDVRVGVCVKLCDELIVDVQESETEALLLSDDVAVELTDVVPELV